MPKVHIVTDQGVLVDTIDPNELDLTKPLAKAALIDDVLTAIKAARKEEGRG